MRFPVKFTRRVGGATSEPVLGTDAAPIGIPGKADNLLQTRLGNSNGWPVQRVCVGYSGPGGALALSAKVYVYDDTTGLWFLAGTKSVAAGSFAQFEVPCLLDYVTASSYTTAAGGGGPGSLEASIVIAAAGSDPAGIYTFVVGADVGSAA